MSTIAHSSKYIVKWVVIKASLCIGEHQKHELEKIGFVRMGLYDSSERVVAKHYANIEEVRADADGIKKSLCHSYEDKRSKASRAGRMCSKRSAIRENGL